MKMIRSLQEQGQIPVSRMCVTCVHFRPQRPPRRHAAPLRVRRCPDGRAAPSPRLRRPHAGAHRAATHRLGPFHRRRLTRRHSKDTGGTRRVADVCPDHQKRRPDDDRYSRLHRRLARRGALAWFRSTDFASMKQSVLFGDDDVQGAAAVARRGQGPGRGDSRRLVRLRRARSRTCSRRSRTRTAASRSATIWPAYAAASASGSSTPRARSTTRRGSTTSTRSACGITARRRT